MSKPLQASLGACLQVIKQKLQGIDASLSLRMLSAELDLEFGRYDFMLDDSGALAFLEVNANGQWVFLDITDKYGLLDCVVTWMKKSATSTL